MHPRPSEILVKILMTLSFYGIFDLKHAITFLSGEMRIMLDHIVGVEEFASIWELSKDEVEDLCKHEKLVSKRIGDTWIIYRDQHPIQIQENDNVSKLSKEIEWDLMSPQEHIAILDENTRIFNRKVNIMKLLHSKQLDEVVIRDLFDDLSDEEYNNVKEAAQEDDDR